jgi:hypothetical protein
MSKISELSDGGVIQGGDTLIAVRSGGNVKVTYGGSTTANIDGGTIDGTVIGGSSAAAGTFTTGQFNTSVNVDGTVTADGLTVDGSRSNFAPNSENFAVYLQYNSATSGFYVGSPSADAMAFSASSGAERMRIDGSGNVGIGAGSPTTSLTLGTGTTGVSFQSGSLALNSGKIAVIKPIEVGTGNGHLVFETYEGGSGGGERMRIDASGNVGIGTTTPAAPLSFGSITNDARIYLRGNTNEFAIGTNGLQTVYAGYGGHVFETGSFGGAEAMRIDSSGNLLVGTTVLPATMLTDGYSGFVVDGANDYIVSSRFNDIAAYFKRENSDGSVVAFYRDGTSVGTISVTTSATTYLTSSDQRLKENIADADDAGSKIDAIKVRQYDWKVDGSHQDYGMVAQELMTVAPEAVSGDPESDEMMGVDYSKLVPMLIKEVQSLRARVAQLEGAN